VRFGLQMWWIGLVGCLRQPAAHGFSLDSMRMSLLSSSPRFSQWLGRAESNFKRMWIPLLKHFFLEKWEKTESNRSRKCPPIFSQCEFYPTRRVYLRESAMAPILCLFRACTPWWWPVCGRANPLHARVWVHGLTGPTWQCCCMRIGVRCIVLLMILGIVISILMWFVLGIFFRNSSQ
jgi:hypothetical protein